MLAQRLETRSKEYMRPLDTEEMKKRHEETVIELRKSRRSDRLMKKRGQICSEPEPRMSPVEVLFQGIVFESTENCPFLDLPPNATVIQRLDCLFSRFRDCTQKDEEKALLSLVHRLLTINENPPLMYAAHSGIVGKLLRLIDSDDVVMALEAAWAITNIASASDETVLAILLHEGAILKLIGNLNRDSEDVVDHCLWALSNMLGGSLKTRKEMLVDGVLDALMPLTDGLRRRSPNIIRDFCWLLSNLCLGSPPIDREHAEKVCWILRRSLQIEDETALCDILKAVYHLTEQDNPGLIATVRDADLLPTIFDFLQHTNVAIKLEALKVIGNFACSKHYPANLLLSRGLLDCVSAFMAQDNDKQMRKEAFWTLSNLLVGLEEIPIVVQHKCFEDALKCMTESAREIRKEAIVCILNASCSRDTDVLSRFVELGGLEQITENLEYPDSRILLSVLEALTHVVTGTRSGPAQLTQEVALHLESAGTVYKLEKLQQYRNVSITKRVEGILKLLDNPSEPDSYEELKTPNTFVFS